MKSIFPEKNYIGKPRSSFYIPYIYIFNEQRDIFEYSTEKTGVLELIIFAACLFSKDTIFFFLKNVVNDRSKT